jgi:hypothetical protein
MCSSQHHASLNFCGLSQGYLSSDDPHRNVSNYRFYEADQPWGPWTLMCDAPAPDGVGWYIPTAPSKWFSHDGRSFKILGAGAWDSAVPDPAHWGQIRYTMYIQDVTLLP